MNSMEEEEEEYEIDHRDDKGMVELMLKSRTGRYVTFFKPHREGSTGEFAQCIAQLPLEKPLVRVKGFVTNCNALAVNVFEFADEGGADIVPEDELDELASKVFKLAAMCENGEVVEG